VARERRTVWIGVRWNRAPDGASITFRSPPSTCRATATCPKAFPRRESQIPVIADLCPLSIELFSSSAPVVSAFSQRHKQRSTPYFIQRFLTVSRCCDCYSEFRGPCTMSAFSRQAPCGPLCEAGVAKRMLSGLGRKPRECRPFLSVGGSHANSRRLPGGARLRSQLGWHASGQDRRRGTRPGGDSAKENGIRPST
jgi:hypothetical protein